MLLSIIIPTFNRAISLQEMLVSVANQNYSSADYEVIVVDNASTDETPEVCRGYKKKIKNFKYMYERIPGLHAARHTGMRNAKGEILVYGDDDIKASSDWVRGILEVFREDSVVLAGGKILPEFEVDPPEWFDQLWTKTSWGKTLYQYSLVDFGDRIAEVPPVYVYGCNFSIRKQLLLDVGGFHPDSLPNHLLRYRGDGETSVSLKLQNLGHKAIYQPKAMVKHRIAADRMTKNYLQKRAYAQGISDSYAVIRKNKGINLSERVWSVVRKLVTRRRYLFKDRHKILRLMYEAYWMGYAFHQQQVRVDNTLLSWVLRDNYLNSANDRLYKS